MRIILIFLFAAIAYAQPPVPISLEETGEASQEYVAFAWDYPYTNKVSFRLSSSLDSTVTTNLTASVWVPVGQPVMINVVAIGTNQLESEPALLSGMFNYSNCLHVSTKLLCSTVSVDGPFIELPVVQATIPNPEDEEDRWYTSRAAITNDRKLMFNED